MKIPIHQVDAFAGGVFRGNPAAVCPLRGWLSDATMQAIAAENNLSETAFTVPRDGTPEEFELRWFTPTIEVELCGHATLATAQVILAGDPARQSVRFHTKSGILQVNRRGELLELDLPNQPGEPCELPRELASALGGSPLAVRRNDHFYLVEYGSQEEVAALAPDMRGLGRASRNFVPTAPGAPDTDVDFVSRMFAPASGIDEDPVCGSSHCLAVPFWAQRLGKDTLHARQISARGGELYCELAGERVKIAGRAVEYLRGEIDISSAAADVTESGSTPAVAARRGA